MQNHKFVTHRFVRTEKIVTVANTTGNGLFIYRPKYHSDVRLALNSMVMSYEHQKYCHTIIIIIDNILLTNQPRAIDDFE